MNPKEFDAGNLAPRAAGSGGDIEKISDRLTTLAHRINDYNATRRGSRLTARPVGDYLPSFLSALAKKHNLDHSPAIGAAGHAQRAGYGDAALEPPPAFKIDADDRLWPVLPAPEPSELRALEDKIHRQTAELSRRSTQIADLSNIRQSQANELEQAFEQIDRLTKAMAELRKMSADREAEVAEAARKLIESETEKVSLQMQLASERKEVNQLSLRLLNIEGVLNDRTVDAAASRETAESLAAELAVAKETANRRHAEQLKQLGADFEIRVGEFHARIAGRDRIIKTLEKANAELAGCCDSLSGKVSALEALQQHAGDTIEAQVGYIEFLETVMIVERDNAQATIKELISEFQSERDRLRDQEQASAEIRKNIVQLLPILAARRYAGADPEPGAARSQVA